MENNILADYLIDYVEIYAPMVKPLAYWHTHALGFDVKAYCGTETGRTGVCSYFLESGDARLVLTSTYPAANLSPDPEISSFTGAQYCGIRRFALKADSVEGAFRRAVTRGAIPLRPPVRSEDEWGWVDEAAIKLYDNSEIVFINREAYTGVFKPGYKGRTAAKKAARTLFTGIDHIAAEVRMNESKLWTDYLNGAIGTSLVQDIVPGAENKTGMVLRINQSADRKLTLVISEPESYSARSNIRKNIDTFGPGIHHVAFQTDDLLSVVAALEESDVEFVNIAPSYYEILAQDPEFQKFDLSKFREHGILIDKEGESFLLQKFIKPIGDRPYFLYEIVQRVNGYTGFALKNINTLKRAEEMEIAKA